MTSPPRYSSLFLTRVRASAGRIGAEVEYIDALNGRLIRLTRRDNACLLGATPIKLWPFNAALSMSVTNDKELVLRLLSGLGLRTPATTIAFTDMARYSHLENPPPSAEDVAATLTFKKPVVVKPNDAKGGDGLSIVYGPESIGRALDYAKGYCHAVLFQDYAPGRDCRVYSLDGEPVLLLSRNVPVLRGDGTSTIRQLAERENPVGDEIQQREGYAITAASFLARHGHSIPAVDQEISLFPVANLAQGGSPEEATSAVPPAWKPICRAITESFRLRFFAIDARLDHRDQAPVIIEVNSNPGIEAVFQASESLGQMLLDLLVTRAIDENLPTTGIQSELPD